MLLVILLATSLPVRAGRPGLSDGGEHLAQVAATTWLPGRVRWRSPGGGTPARGFVVPHLRLRGHRLHPPPAAAWQACWWPSHRFCLLIGILPRAAEPAHALGHAGAGSAGRPMKAGGAARRGPATWWLRDWPGTWPPAGAVAGVRPQLLGHGCRRRSAGGSDHPPPCRPRHPENNRHRPGAGRSWPGSSSCSRPVADGAGDCRRASSAPKCSSPGSTCWRRSSSRRWR